jgi:hypothetical protein
MSVAMTDAIREVYCESTLVDSYACSNRTPRSTLMRAAMLKQTPLARNPRRFRLTTGVRLSLRYASLFIAGPLCRKYVAQTLIMLLQIFGFGDEARH